jgi:hypothetical protein
MSYYTQLPPEWWKLMVGVMLIDKEMSMSLRNIYKLVKFS